MNVRVMLWSFIACSFADAQAATLLPKLRQIEQLRSSLLQNWTRVNNVEVHESMNSTSFCHIVDLNFHSRLLATGEHVAVPGLPAQTAAAIALAIEHLNAGDGSVVREVEGLNKRCNIRFTTEFLDTAFSPSFAVDQVINAIGRKDRKPCAFLGAGLSTVSMATATISGLKGLPQLSWLSISSKLSDAEQFPLFARLAPPLETIMGSRLELLYTTLGVRHLAWVYADDAGIVAESDAVQAIAREKYPDLVLHPVPYAGAVTESTARTVVRNIRDTGLMYVFLAVAAPHDVDPFMQEAFRQGVAGSGRHVWIFRTTNREADGAVLRSEFAPGDPVLRSIQGTLRLEPVLGASGIGRYDSFINAWKEIGTNEEDKAYLRSALPSYPDDPTYQAPLSFENASSFIVKAYDAAILLGLAACGTSTPYFTGAEMHASMLNTSFVGASGTVGIDPETRALAKAGGMYRLMNAVASERPNGNFTVTEAEVAFFNGTTWTLTDDIIFNDGTSKFPPDLPPVFEDFHLVNTELRIFGFLVSAVVVLTSIGMSVWACTFAKRARVIQAAQPLFLHLICIGTALMGLAVIPLSIDDIFMSEEAADAACLIFPWLLALGWAISFSALFSKTMRVNKLFHNPSFRRITVSASDVMRPMVLLLVGTSKTRFTSETHRAPYFYIPANVLILLLWSLISPLKYERIMLAVDRYMRPSASLGRCESDHFWWFFTPLAALNFAALVVANQQAYVARKISTEFAESDYIARAMSLIAVVALLVVPVAMMSGANTNMHFFISVCFVSTVALSLLLYIFVPKILYRSRNGSIAKAIRSTVSKQSFETQSTHTLEDNASSGELVLVHPKLAAADTARMQTLLHENEQLIRKVASLKARIPGLGDEDSPDCCSNNGAS